MAVIRPTSFVTFGMFIIDEIEWQTADPPAPKHNLIGGAGTYAVLGARLASSPCQLLARSISWIVDRGVDFPPEVNDAIDSWNTDCIFRTDHDRLTTRAWNGYGENEVRAFKYLTPKVRLEVSSLNVSQLRSKSFHMVCSPQRCLDITTKLARARHDIDQSVSPAIVWEPIPDLCTPEELERLQTAAKQCSIISPNHDELKMFFDPKINETASQADLVARLMPWSALDQDDTRCSVFPVAVVREGANGSTAYFYNRSDQLHPLSCHLPAYHTSHMAASVVDPTGGGNTYLGALAIALTDALCGQASYQSICKELGIVVPKTTVNSAGESVQPVALTQTITIAMIYALIAASYAIEQNGTPILKQDKIFTEIIEYWNGEKFIDRLSKYLTREGASIREQLDDITWKPF